ncbi:MAG: hypothetical protein AABO57_05935 [Acidobacteriota bacterium]
MTELLERAITEIGKRPAEEQDAIAARILAELADEEEWTTRFNATTDQQWDRLSELARQEIRAGDTNPLDDVFPGGDRSL